MTERHCDQLVSRPHMFAPSHCRFAGTIPDEDGVSWWCKRHSPEAKAKRQTTAQERFDHRWQGEKERIHRVNCYPTMLTALHDIEQAAEWGLAGEDARDRLGKISEIAQDAIRKSLIPAKSGAKG